MLSPSTSSDGLLKEIVSGLRKSKKELPTKLFYDEKGSQLFDEICLLEEYYLTRTEIHIMEENIDAIVELIKDSCILIEYGSGNSTKTRCLLDHLPDLAAYLPVDISKDYLNNSVEALKKSYPHLEINPILADYNQPIQTPETIGLARKLAYFPGSTIGNFTPDQAIEFMQNIARVVGQGGGFLIGVDLIKDTEVLHKAYNDVRGITAEFNLNILTHINELFSATFRIENFKHFAFYNEEANRIEMHLISELDQTVDVGDETFNFNKGENILTEVSYKYSLIGFADLAFQAGFDVKKVWTDPNNYFSIQYLIAR